MTRDEELSIREAAMFCWELPGGSFLQELRCCFCGQCIHLRFVQLADESVVSHAERHLGGILTPKDAATICSLRALGFSPEQIVQQVTGHPPCIAAEPRPNQNQYR